VPINPFRGPTEYRPAEFLADVEAITEMLVSGAPARLPDPEPMEVCDEATGAVRLVRINTDLATYKVYAYFVDKYGEPGLRRHVVYFGVIRYLRHNRDRLLADGRLTQEADRVRIDPGLLADLLARPAEDFLD